MWCSIILGSALYFEMHTVACTKSQDAKPTPMEVDNQIKKVQSKLLDVHAKAAKHVVSKTKVGGE